MWWTISIFPLTENAYKSNVCTYNYHYWACRDIYKSVRRTCVITVDSSRGGLITPLTLIFINSAANNEALVLSRMKLSGQPN